MRQQSLRDCEKPHGVQQGRVPFKGSFIHPLRMDREHEWFPQRLEHIDAQATNLGTRRFIDPKQLIAKCRFFFRQRLKADNKVK